MLEVHASKFVKDVCQANKQAIDDVTAAQHAHNMMLVCYSV